MAETVDERRVKEIIASVCSASGEAGPLRPDEIDSDRPLYSLGPEEDSLALDSLDAVEIASELEDSFDVVLPAEVDPLELRTVRDIVGLLERLLREQRAPSA